MYIGVIASEAVCVSEEVSGLRVVQSRQMFENLKVILLSFVEIAYRKAACTFGVLQNNSYFDTLPRRRDGSAHGSAHRRLPHVEDDHKYRRDDNGLYVRGTRWRIPRAFLDKAEAQMGKGQQGEAKRSGILPYYWWSQEKKTVCEERMRTFGRGGISSTCSRCPGAASGPGSYLG